jgi:uncharacterized protein involved in exopolysaccharide biosynthesis
VALAERLKLLVLGPLAAGLVALGVTYLIKPTFTARTSFLPPQQQQSSALAALSSLGALGGLAGAAAGIRSPIDQFVSLLQSTTVAERMIDAFELMSVYGKEKRFEAREKLADNVRVAAGRRDGIISVEVDDHDPKRAAAMANRYVDELRRVTSELALTEAQQRRVFFERQLQQTRDRLTQAQVALQASGYSAGALKAEPRAAAERYARLQAEVTAAEVRLQTLRSAMVDTTPEVQQQQAQLGALRAQLARAELPARSNDQNADYVGKYREFKYQETLFELFARQFELARLDESREGVLIQVVDAALVPEHKSRPKRAMIAIGTTASVFIVLVLGLIARLSFGSGAGLPDRAQKVRRLRAVFGRHAAT